MITLRWIEHGSSDYEAVVQLRRRVLRLPLGLDFTAEQLAAEVADSHLAAYDGTTLVGCLMLSDRGQGTVQMRQVAVDPARQGEGIGTLLVHEGEGHAKGMGYAKMLLHARETAVPFYEKWGYACVGAPFEEVSIPHREMEKAL
jgi:GNAT superfamily N-acetyltransferase